MCEDYASDSVIAATDCPSETATGPGGTRQVEPRSQLQRPLEFQALLIRPGCKNPERDVSNVESCAVPNMRRTRIILVRSQRWWQDWERATVAPFDPVARRAR